MDEEKKYSIAFNRILYEEMRGAFDLEPLPLNPDFKVKHSTEKSKGAVIKSEYLGCAKTGGIRMGALYE